MHAKFSLGAFLRGSRKIIVHHPSSLYNMALPCTNHVFVVSMPNKGGSGGKHHSRHPFLLPMEYLYNDLYTAVQRCRESWGRHHVTINFLSGRNIFL